MGRSVIEICAALRRLNCPTSPNRVQLNYVDCPFPSMILTRNRWNRYFGQLIGTYRRSKKKFFSTFFDFKFSIRDLKLGIRVNKSIRHSVDKSVAVMSNSCNEHLSHSTSKTYSDFKPEKWLWQKCYVGKMINLLTGAVHQKAC